MDSQEFRRRGREVIDFIIEYINTVSKRPILPETNEGHFKELLTKNAPTKGENFNEIISDVKSYILPRIVHWRHPRYFAFFPCEGSYTSIVADILISTINCNTFSWAAGPSCTELEMIVLDWLGKMIGLPPEFKSSKAKGGGGALQVCSYDALLINMIAARHIKMKEKNHRSPTTDRRTYLPFFMAYGSKLSHALLTKCAELSMVQVHLLETDNKYRLRGKTLAQAIKDDIQKGFIPFFVQASLGTAACGSCDDLEEIGPVCEEYRVWLHVDATYAGSALICPEYQRLLKGIEYAESFTTDPSMWMLVTFNCCAMWIKDRNELTESLTIDPVYVDHSFSNITVDYRHWGMPLTRKFRALKLWFVIRMYGVEGLQKYIRRHVHLANLFEKLVRGDDRFVVENEVNFGIVCFRIKDCNILNVRLLKKVNDSREIFIVGTMLGPHYILRLCICSENTKEEDIYIAWELISKAAGEILADKEHFNVDTIEPDSSVSTLKH